MKGQLEDTIIAMSIVFLFILFVGVFAGLYIRHMLGLTSPVVIESYTEYKWSQFLPFSLSMYFTYSKIPYDIIKSLTGEDKEECHQINPGRYPLLEKMINRLKQMPELKNKNIIVVKKKNGIAIVAGLDEKGACEETYPTSSPYFCESTQYPLFSKKIKTLTIALCCLKVNSCEDYNFVGGELVCRQDLCKVGEKTGKICIIAKDGKCRGYDPYLCEENPDNYFLTHTPNKKIKKCSDYKDVKTCKEDPCLVAILSKEKRCFWDYKNRKCSSNKPSGYKQNINEKYTLDYLSDLPIALP